MTGSIDAAADLNRFHQDGSDFLCPKKFSDLFFHGGKLLAGRTTFFHVVRITDTAITFWKRSEVSKPAELLTKRRAEVFAMCGVQCAVAESMISTFERNHPAFVSRAYRRFQCCYHGFEAGVAENCLPGLSRPALERNPTQLSGELRLERMRMHIAHCVQQLRHLPLPGAHNSWIRVTCCRDAKCRREIEILFPVRIPNVNSARTFPNNRP